MNLKTSLQRYGESLNRATFILKNFNNYFKSFINGYFWGMN